MSKTLPKALGYLRKSTKGTRADGRQRQEKSIAQQKSEIIKLVRNHYEIVAWYIDDGVSGWKREAGRPDFQRMLAEAQGHGAVAIVCDNLDRFSRAAVGDVQADANSLRQSGVRWIVTNSHGIYDLGARYDIGEILKFTVAVWSSCEYSRQLSRRISLARRNRALDGKRSGGARPMGYVATKDGGLKLGDAKEIKIIRWIFEWFVTKRWSLNAIAAELNKQKTPASRGGIWWTAAVRDILLNPVYAGGFRYNHKPAGHFYGVDGKGEIVEKESVEGKGKVWIQWGTHEGLVPRKTFDQAQARIEERGRDKSRQKRMGYALTGVLVCSHCNRGMYGVTVRGKTVYRCTTSSVHGKGSCQKYMIREERILPFVAKLVAEEIASITELLHAPPEELLDPQKARVEHRAELEVERDKLSKQIAKATQNLMLCEDARSRKDMDAAVTAMRDRAEEIDRDLDGGAGDPVEYRPEELEALEEWWQAYQEKAVQVPWSGNSVPPGYALYQDDDTLEHYLVDPLALNAALADLGAEVKLSWDTATRKLANGATRNAYTLKAGRFRLGRQSGKVPRKVLVSSVG